MLAAHTTAAAHCQASRLLPPPAPASLFAGAPSMTASRAQRRARHWECRQAAAASEDGGPLQEEDRGYMRHALRLARTALGQTHPNPAVGCVIVKDGQVVGEGFHPKAGMPHAEVYALRAAGNSATGATAYVTLEPCNHYGRTPPCSRALVDARVARVVIGAGDPNPLVASAGIATLKKAGIKVDLMDGPVREEAYALNPEFMERMHAEALLAAQSEAA